MERAIKQQLTRGRQQQIFAAHHFSDLHGGIVHHHGELVGGNVIVTPNDKISKVGTNRFVKIIKQYEFNVKYTIETVVERAWSGRSCPASCSGLW